jgi:hypothetical protein
MPRAAKQIIIALIYIALWTGVGAAGYDILTPDATCTDGIQNQEEQGVDCGPVCGKLCDPEVQALQVKSVKVLPTGTGYDLFAEVFNPNLIYGSGQVSYQLVVQDAQGTPLLTENSSLYILPKQTRYLVRVGLRVSGTPASANLSITAVQWQKADFADTAIDFPVRREQYTDNGQAGASFEGVLFNNSDFDFGRVDIAVMLLDQAGEVVAVNPSVINTFVAKTERSFVAQWPFAIPVASPRVNVQATTNVFLNSNFVKTYGSPDKIQKFY